jgi:hypothetical protein
MLFCMRRKTGYSLDRKWEGEGPPFSYVEAVFFKLNQLVRGKSGCIEHNPISKEVESQVLIKSSYLIGLSIVNCRRS